MAVSRSGADDGGAHVFAADHGAGEEVVGPRALRQRIQVDPALFVAGERHARARTVERFETHFEAGNAVMIQLAGHGELRSVAWVGYCAPRSLRKPPASLWKVCAPAAV